MRSRRSGPWPRPSRATVEPKRSSSSSWAARRFYSTDTSSRSTPCSRCSPVCLGCHTCSCRSTSWATPFFLFFYTYVVSLAWTLCTNTSAPLAVKRLTFAILIGLFVGVTLDQATKRSEQFAAQPATSLALVAEYFGDRYNQVAEALGLDSASLLTVNQGGTLLASRLKVFDLGGLCDRTIARTIGRDQQAFYDYVFEQIRPTFIEVHTGWIRTA